MSAVRQNIARVIGGSKERSLAERDLVSWGGYGLQISPCIEGTSSCGDSCCPNEYKCASAGNHKDNFSPTEAICCPTDADCSATVEVVQACADTSWGLYHAFGKFCCPSDFVGIYPEGGTGLMCMSGSLPVPSDKLALSVEQATSTKVAVATGGGSLTSSASSGTITPGPGSQSPAGTTGSSPKSGGLSKSATIATAVLATALGLLSILIIGYFLWRKKRRSNRQVPSSSSPPTAEAVSAIARSSAPEKDQHAHPVEAKTAEFQVNELSGRNILRPADTTELESPRRAELHATGRVQ